MFGETKEGREFVPTLRTLVARVAARVRVLNGLDERYSRADVEHLPPQVRAKLQHLLNLQFAALNDDLIELDGRLSLLAGTSAARRAVSLKAAPDDWRRRVQATRPAANVLGASIEPLVTLDAPGQLETTVLLGVCGNRSMGMPTFTRIETCGVLPMFSSLVLIALFTP